MVLFHRFLTASVSLYTSSVSLFPPFSLPFRFPSIYPSFLCVDIFFLFLVYSTFTTMSFFSPSLYSVVSIPFCFHRESSLFLIFRPLVYSLSLPFTCSLSHAFSVPLAPTPSTLTRSAFFLVRLLTRSVSFMSLPSLSDSRAWSGSLFARQPSPLPSLLRTAIS